MTILTPATDLPFAVTRLSHVTLTSRDLDATRYFYETGLGLEVTHHDNSRLCLRAIEETAHHSLVFEKTEADGPGVVRRIGYRLSCEADLDRAEAWFHARGVPAERVARPDQGSTLAVTDGVGVPIEFCATMNGLCVGVASGDCRGRLCLRLATCHRPVGVTRRSGGLRRMVLAYRVGLLSGLVAQPSVEPRGTGRSGLDHRVC